MKVGFRTDGGGKIGLGHIMRCIALAQQFKDMSHSCVFYTTNDDCSEILDYYGMESHILSLDSKNDGNNEFRYEQIDLLIADTYALDDSDYRIIKQNNKNLYLVCFDGQQKYPEHTDGIINYSYSCNVQKYEEQCQGKDLFLGTKWTPIRKEFSDKYEYRGNRSCRRILFTGGAYSERLANLMIPYLKNAEMTEAEYYFLVPGAFAKMASGFTDDSKIHLIEQRPDPSEIYQTMDLVVTAAGTSLYEYEAIGLPAIVFVAIQNQLANSSNHVGKRWIGTFSEEQQFAEQVIESLKKCCDSVRYYRAMCDELVYVAYRDSCAALASELIDKCIKLHN